MTLHCLQHDLYTAAGSEAACDGLRSFAAPGDRIRLAFDLTSTTGVDEVRLTATDLRAAAARMAEDAVDIRLVRPDGLLLSDDRTALEGDYRSLCGHWQHLHRIRHRQHFYRGPLVAETRTATTSLQANERKQVCVRVHVPADSPAGRYEGAIAVMADGTTASLPLTVDVAAVTIHEPQQIRMLWYLGTLDCRRPRHWVTESTFRAQLQDVRDHGFNTISLHETDRTLLDRACAIARDIGFSSVVLETPYPDDLSPADLHGLRLICYVSDEPDRRGPATVAMHRTNMAAASRLGAATFTSLTEERFTARFVPDDLGRRPDWVSLYVPRNGAYLRGHAARAASEPSVLYYWLANAPDPRMHRTLTGVFLWMSRAAGVSPYCYQHLPAFPGSPWDDDVDADGERRQMATYPASPETVGSIPTVRWEAMADGFTDLRHLVTVTNLLDRARTKGPAVQPLCDQVARRLREIGDYCFTETGLRSLTAEEFDRLRETVVTDAMALHAAMDSLA